VALFIVRPMFEMAAIDYLLAFVGGVMTAVCGVELWPEARKCRHDRRLAQGIALGSVLMGWTLYVGV
jgi:ZIP family zinc transporter